MAILDEDADIISVNEAWRRFGADNGGSEDGYVGYNYLDVCSPETDPGATDASSLVRALLSGDREHGQLEYRKRHLRTIRSALFSVPLTAA